MPTQAETIIAIIAEQFGRDTSEITLQTTPADLSLDSLDEIEIVMELEDEFDLSIPDEVVETWKTVADVVAYVAKETGEVVEAPAN